MCLFQKQPNPVDPLSYSREQDHLSFQIFLKRLSTEHSVQHGQYPPLTTLFC